MTDKTLNLPLTFKLTQYHLTIETLEPLSLPPFKGSALRGGFGHTFKRLVCRQPWPCDKKCHLGNDCPYGYVFETTSPADAKALRNFSDVPRPFIIQSPADHRTHIASGEQLAFGLTLVGQGINYLPYFIAVFREMGRVGLGKTRGRYRLLSVELAHPFERGTEPIYLADSELIRVPELATTAKTILAHAATLPTDQITLNFLSPTRIKHKGKWTRQGPPFQALIQTLLGRISSLSYFHCGRPFEADFRGLIDRAADVKSSHCDTHWQDWSRFSGRQKQRINMGGLTGHVTYVGNLTDYLPLLVLGELVHVGKGTVFGNGQYEIARDDV